MVGLNIRLARTRLAKSFPTDSNGFLFDPSVARKLVDMKVIHLVASGGMYGKEQVILELMREHRSAGMESILGCIRVSGDQPKDVAAVAQSEGFPVQTFALRRGLDLRGGREMAAWLSGNRIDIVHVHDYKASVLLGMQRWRCKLPPLVRTLHGFTATRKLSSMAAYEWLDRQSLRFHDAVVGVSIEMESSVPVPITVIRNGIRSVDFAGRTIDRSAWPKQINAFASSGTILGTVARLSTEKNQLEMINATAELIRRGRDVKLLIVGEGPERATLEAEIARSNLTEKVLLAGFTKHARQTLSVMDLYLQPSLTEGTPISILEAMDAGVAIGMSRVGGMTGLVDRGVGFELPLEAEPMADAIERLLDDSEQITKLVQQAKQEFHATYSAKIMADAYRNVYQALEPNRKTEP